jgi:DNA-binding XRE family transcriptional regulator
MERPAWNRPGYQRLARVAWQRPDLMVDFAGGTRARVEASRLLLPDDGPVEWDRMTWSPYEIAVPGPAEIVIIPWSRLRALTDPAYAAHLATSAATEAHQVGQRLRQLRKARGLTVPQLAARVGVSAHDLACIERGQPTDEPHALQPLLAALGCTLHDLVAPGPPAAPRQPATSR